MSHSRRTASNIFRAVGGEYGNVGEAFPGKEKATGSGRPEASRTSIARQLGHSPGRRKTSAVRPPRHGTPEVAMDVHSSGKRRESCFSHGCPNGFPRKNRRERAHRTREKRNTPQRIRTFNLRFRRPVLYPIELGVLTFESPLDDRDGGRMQSEALGFGPTASPPVPANRIMAECCAGCKKYSWRLRCVLRDSQ